MKNYNFGDLVKVELPLSQEAGTKERPALILFDTGDADIVLCSITSKKRITRYDVEITQWQQAGLNVLSFVRVHKIATLEKADILKNLGRLSADDLKNIRAVLENLWKTI